jgi:hypothetical protein
MWKLTSHENIFISHVESLMWNHGKLKKTFRENGLFMRINQTLHLHWKYQLIYLTDCLSAVYWKEIAASYSIDYNKLILYIIQIKIIEGHARSLHFSCRWTRQFLTIKLLCESNFNIFTLDGLYAPYFFSFYSSCLTWTLFSACFLCGLYCKFFTRCISTGPSTTPCIPASFFVPSKSETSAWRRSRKLYKNYLFDYW